MARSVQQKVRYHLQTYNHLQGLMSLMVLRVTLICIRKKVSVYIEIVFKLTIKHKRKTFIWCF